MSSDNSDIEQLIRTYFESMHESSREKVNEVFLPTGRLTGYTADGFAELSVADFAEYVASQVPSPADKGDTRILDTLSVHIAGSTAVARVRDGYLGQIFLDTLSCVKVDGRWRIAHKLFEVESQ